MSELPTAYPLRDLFDAAARGRNVRLTCGECGHVAILHGMGLWWLFQKRGWMDAFSDVRRRSICMVCWCRFRRKVRNPALDLVEDPPTDTRLNMPSQLEWKKELRRRR